MESFVCETPNFPKVSFNQDNNDVHKNSLYLDDTSGVIDSYIEEVEPLSDKVDEVLSSKRFVYSFNSALYQTIFTLFTLTSIKLYWFYIFVGMRITVLKKFLMNFVIPTHILQYICQLPKVELHHFFKGPCR